MIISSATNGYRHGKKAFCKEMDISIIEVENSIGKKYKVTRRIPEMSVAETKVFRTKEEAKKQFNEWLSE